MSHLQSDIRDWQWPGKDGQYMCSTNPDYLQLDAIFAAFNSDMLWWVNPVNEATIKKMTENSLCLGLYAQEADGTRVMVGLARIITDRVTFGYLTDVYVLKEHQAKGLGRWLMTCVKELVQEWPGLRGFWLLSGSATASNMYEAALGARTIGKCHLKAADLNVMAIFGPGYPNEG